MLHITLEEIQNGLPSRKVYAWYWKYFPELEVYRAMVWMEFPYKDAEKCRYDKYIPQGLAPTKEHVLRLLSESLRVELESNAQRGLHKA